MSAPAKLCLTCLEALRSGLEEALEKSLYVKCAHHITFADFQNAVAQDCFICTKLWNSIRKEVLASWENGKTIWLPPRCSLQRRTWAPELYGAIYWHIVYMEFYFPLLDSWDFNYRGNVFCLYSYTHGRLIPSAAFLSQDVLINH